MLTELLYIRHFGNFYYGNIIKSGNITDSSIIDSAISILQLKDILLLLPSVILTVPFILFRNDIKTAQYSSKIRIIWICILILIPIFQFITSFRRLYLWAPAEHRHKEHVAIKTYHTFFDPSYKPVLCHDYGVVFLAIRTLCDLFPKKLHLSADDRTAIESALSNNHASVTSYPSKFEGNNAKNLIFLIVESLNSSVMYMDEASSVCPNLYAMTQDSSSVYVKNVISQIGMGYSSDGQLMYNTGLLPVRQIPFVTEYGLSDYPSLAKALVSHANSEVIYENKNLWNHWSTSISYGYEKLYCNLAPKNEKNRNEDFYVINRTIDVIDSIAQPFYIQVTTYSTHEPYDRLRSAPLLKTKCKSISNLDVKSQNYLESICFFDSQLGRLIEYLRNKNILDKTIIAIIGDHPAPEVSLSACMNSKSVPFVIYNAGLNLKYDKYIGQIDVFPTLLDVMGVGNYIIPQTGKNYRGLGKSLFSNNPPTFAIDNKGSMYSTDGTPADQKSETDRFLNLWHLSEQMILSRFFDK